MDQPFVLERGPHQRFSVYPPVDPYGDGYVAHLRVHVVDEGLCAETTATIDGYATSAAGDLAGFIRQLADDWQGWPGSRVWRALGDEMTLEAQHDGRGHVALGMTLRQSRHAYDEDAWSARVVFTLEAGEEMTALAGGIESLLGQEPRDPTSRGGK